MFQWIVLIVTVLGSYVVSRLFNSRQMSFMIPFCMAYVLALAATVGSIGGVLHFLFTAFNFVITMFLCHGFPASYFRRNPSWSAFMVFWFYMFIIVFTGFFPIEGACKYLQEYVGTFLAGFCLAMWMCRANGRLRKVLTSVCVAAIITIVYTYLHGGFESTIVDEFGRAGLDEELIDEGRSINVNFIAICCASFLPFLLLLVLQPVANFREKTIRILGLFSLILITLMLIRTGSRNGGLALLPCVWYYLKSSGRKSNFVGKIVLCGMIVLFVFIGLRLTMGSAVKLRAFNLSGDDALAESSSVADRITTGRFGMYKKNYNSLTTAEKIFGKGFTLTNSRYAFLGGKWVKIEKMNSGNAHSMYMALFYRSGFVGAFLFLIFLIASIRQGFRLGTRGRIGLLFMGIWLCTGVGEGLGMTGGITALLAGISMGLFTNQHVVNPELMNEQDWNYARRNRLIV